MTAQMGARSQPPYGVAAAVIGMVGAAVWAGFLPAWASLAACALCAEGMSQVMDVVQRRARLQRVKTMELPMNKGTKFSWEQVAMHNTADSAWIAIRGKVYDVTTFLDRHPGGYELLLLCCGRDATDLFISYHPFTKKPEQMLSKFEIGTVNSYEHATFKKDSGFYRECAERVQEFFERSGKDSKNPMLMTARMLPVYLVGVACFYLTFVKSDASVALKLFGAALLGVCQGLPLTGWMHDASHAAIGHSEAWWWTVGRVSLDWISGSSMVSWRNQHVIGHHVYTNVFGNDPDLPADKEGDFRRVSDHQLWDRLYSLQHFYVPPLYGLLAMKARLQDFYEIFGRHRNGPIRVNPISAQDYLRLGASKTFWFWYRFVVPHVLFGCDLGSLLCYSFVTDMMVGYWLAFNFQVSHISTECDFYSDSDSQDKKVIADEWAVLQVKTSLDYGHNDPVATYMSGALNYQTAHHLFPCVSQCYYPAITPIIMDVCRKYGIRYNVLPNYRSAISAHISHLREMGREGKAPELKLE